MLFFVSIRMKLSFLSYDLFLSLYCMCVRYNDVLQRCKELDSWTQDLSLPSVVWLSGLFNPQSFLTGNAHSSIHKSMLPGLSSSFFFLASPLVSLAFQQ